MKLNNKGMSIIEITVTFTLIMAMVVGMLAIVMNYRDKASVSLKKLEMDTFKNTLTKDIQDDVSSLGVNEVNTGGQCANIQGLNKCINIVFKDGTEKILGTSYVDSADINSVENKYVYYDGDKYKLKDILPDSIPEGRNILDLQTIIVDDSEILKTTTITSNGSDVNIYTINISVSHFDFDEDFGIHLVVSNDDISFIEEEPVLLVDSIFDNNVIVSSIPILKINNFGKDKGLYKSTATNSGDPTYYFRGNVENNYVDFAGFTWRILRINEDNTIRLQLQNGINDNTTYYFNFDYSKFDYMYYSNCDAKNLVDTWYLNNIQNKNYSDKVVTGNYFCQQAKVRVAYSGNNEVLAGNAVLADSSNYVADFKCTNDANGYGLYNSNVGLVSLDELIHHDTLNASVAPTLNSDKFSWTMSPSGIIHVIINGNEIYYQGVWYYKANMSFIGWFNANKWQAIIQPVINLKADVMATGSGLASDPYVIQ